MRARTTTLLTLVLLCAGLLWLLAQDDRPPAAATAPILPGFSADAVRLVTIERDAGRTRLVRQNGHWMIEQPVHAPALAEPVARLLATLEALGARESLSPQDLRRRELVPRDFGLDPPLARLHLATPTRQWFLAVGGDVPAATGQYLRVDTDISVLAASGDVLGRLPTTPTAWRDTRLFAGLAGQLTRVDLTRPGAGQLRLALVDGAWVLQQPEPARADAPTVEAWLDRLMALRASAFLWDRDPESEPAGEWTRRLETYGLHADEAALRITLWTADREPAAQLLIGQRTADGVARHARVAARDSIFTLPSVDTDPWLELGPNRLRDRTLFPDLPDAVLAVRVEEGEARLALRREGTAWRIEEPVQGQADPVVVARFAAAAQALQLRHFVEPSPTNLAALGLAPPEFSLTLETAGGPTRLDFGSADIVAGLRFARLPPASTVFLLDREAADAPWRAAGMEALRTDPGVFRNRSMLQLDPATIRSIGRKVQGTEQEIRRLENGDWTVAAGPTNAIVDTETVADLLIEVSDLRAVRAEGLSPGDLSRFGLAEPAVIFTFGLRGDDAIQKRILLGVETPAGHCAAVQGRDTLFTLADDTYRRLLAPLLRLPDPAPDPTPGP